MRTFLQKALNWSQKAFMISKVKNTVSWMYVISDLNGEEIDVTFYKKGLQKRNETEFKFEKVTMKKGNKLYKNEGVFS